MSKLKIRQVRSTSLGLRRIRDTVVHEDIPQIRGMVNKVSHLVEYEEVDE